MNSQPIHKLKELLTQYGESLCGNARLCESLLRDTCGEYRRELNVIVSAVREGVASELLASRSNGQYELLLPRLIRKLEDNFGLTEDAARWGVTSWALALGIMPVEELDRLCAASARAKQFHSHDSNTHSASGAKYSRQGQLDHSSLNGCLLELSGGAGQQVTEPFNLANGLTVFEMAVTGSEEYSGITLIDTDGEHVELLVNETADFYGVKAIRLDDTYYTGQYLLDVDAGGDWNIKISQPSPRHAGGKPQTFAGNGQRITPFIFLNRGLTIFRLRHNGESNFSPTLLNAAGEHIELLTNKVGTVSASKTVKIEDDGLYIIDVCADGDWIITAE